MKETTLLTNEERTHLPQIIKSRLKFKKIIKTSVQNYSSLFSNCLMISGKPGSGKTTLTVDYLDQLQEQEIIAGYKRASGHLTPRSLYNLLYEASTPIEGLPQVVVLDDVDCLKDPGCLELLKSAFDSKSSLSTNRQVHYLSEGRKNFFKFDGFGIIITNDNFLDKEINVHLQALMDRVQCVSCDLQPSDMEIFTTSLVEDYLNDSKSNLKESEIDSIVDMFNTDIRRWMKTDAFRKANVPYSLRLVKKFVDAQRMFQDDWKDFNLSYLRLSSAADMSETLSSEESSEESTVRRTRSSKGEPPKNANGKYYNPVTGKEYPYSGQYYYRKKYSA